MHPANSMLQVSKVHSLPSLHASLLGILEQYPEMHSSIVQSISSEQSVWFWHCVGEDDGAKLVVGDMEGVELRTDEGLSELIVGGMLGSDDGEEEGSSELIVGELLGSDDGDTEGSSELIVGELLGSEDGDTEGSSELIEGELLGSEDGDTEGSSELIEGELLGSEDGGTEAEDGDTDGSSELIVGELLGTGDKSELGAEEGEFFFFFFFLLNLSRFLLFFFMFRFVWEKIGPSCSWWLSWAIGCAPVGKPALLSCTWWKSPEMTLASAPAVLRSRSTGSSSANVTSTPISVGPLPSSPLWWRRTSLTAV